jgi:hypothetical protein
LRLLCREVVLLVGIVAEIEKLDVAAILEKLDELPVPLADGARRRRLADIAGEVPEQPLALERCLSG